MSKPIKILDLRDSSWVDGPGRTVLETAEAIDLDKYCVFVGGFCSELGKLSRYLVDARTRHLKICPIVEKGPFDYRVIRQILTVIDKYEIDLVHTHDFRSNIVGLFCAKRRRLPTVATCHGWIVNDFRGSVKKAIDLRLLSNFDRVITVSESIRRELIEQGLNARKMDVIANALVIKDFQANADEVGFRQELGLNRSTRLLVNIGRLSTEKGQSLLLDAIAEVRVKVNDIFLVCVGAGPDEDGLKAKVKALDLENTVAFTGYRSDISNVYNSADLVIQSSFTEGMPNVVLEALLMETPVIATDVGGTSEIIEDGVTGYLVEPGSVHDLVAKILEFIGNQSMYQAAACRGQEVVKQRFNHGERVRRLSNVYASVTGAGDR